VLAEVIRTFNNPMGRIFVQEELVKAYYLMGRNLDDYHHNYSDAADFYIEADRLKTKDLILRGRINSCMGYLCKQDSCFGEALVFYERSSNAFKVSGNEWYYAHNLLNVAEQYVNLREYDKADSVLAIAERYEIDSAYYANVMDVKAMALFNQQKYNLALACLLETKDYQQNVEVQSYRAMKMMQLYARMDSLRQIIPLANYILQNSTNAIFRSNAYFYLIQDAEKCSNAKEVAKYSYLREDEDRRVRHASEFFAQASTKLKVYLQNPNPYRKMGSCIAIIGLLLILVTGGALWLCKHYFHTVKIGAKNKAKRRAIFTKRVFNHSIHFVKAATWKDDKTVRDLANLHFSDMFNRLEDTYHLSEREMQICLMILLEYSREQMADILHLQPNTISKAKLKIAKELKTNSATLRDYLIDFLAE
jgi:DNA-binding CsgD family transcriptional regulator